MSNRIKLAISNIGWNQDEEIIVAQLLFNRKIRFIEIAPTKVWPNPLKVSENEVKNYINFWHQFNISIIAFQALLFGHPELTIFESKEKRELTYQYLCSIIQLASKVGAKYCIFGSPKNRVTRLNSSLAEEIALDFFDKLGSFSLRHGVVFCIEPNPAQYGCNFIKNTKEGVDFVKKVNNAGFKLHLDTGCLALNHENIQKSINISKPSLSYFHVSEPYLNSISKKSNYHNEVAKYLKKIHYSEIVSIEMRAKIYSNITIIKKALSLLTKLYLT